MFFIAPLVAVFITLSGTAYAEDDAFINAALDPSLHRDAHGTGIGVFKTESASTEDGQSTGMTYNHAGVSSNLWNNEHNQVLFGVQYGSRLFDREINLPDGVVLPDRIDRASAAVVYKHVTSGDWSFAQSFQLSRTGSGSLSGPGTDGVDLVGLATVSREPGYAWMYGYAWNQTGNSKFKAPIPLIEYYDGSSEEFSFVVGFPILGLNYSPHPDWWLALNWAVGGGPSASAFYKISGRNFVNIAYGDEGWSYRLAGPVQKNVAYSAHRVSVGWSFLPFFERRRSIGVNVFISRDLDRKLGSDNKLSMDDAASIGFNIGYGF